MIKSTKQTHLKKIPNKREIINFDDFLVCCWLIPLVCVKDRRQLIETLSSVEYIKFLQPSRSTRQSEPRFRPHWPAFPTRMRRLQFKGIGLGYGHNLIKSIYLYTYPLSALIWSLNNSRNVWIILILGSKAWVPVQTSWIVEQITIGHLSNSSVKNAIRIVLISIYFGTNLGCSFTQMRHEKNK